MKNKADYQYELEVRYSKLCAAVQMVYLLMEAVGEGDDGYEDLAPAVTNFLGYLVLDHNPGVLAGKADEPASDEEEDSGAQEAAD